MHCSFNLNNDLRRWVLSLFPFCRWGSGGSGLSTETPDSCGCGCTFKPESASWRSSRYATQPPGHSTYSTPLRESPFSQSVTPTTKGGLCTQSASEYREMGFLCPPNCWNEWWTLKGFTMFSFDERHQLLVCLPWDCLKSSWIKSAFILTI